ncbi:hypothetical protein FRX31_008354 [Thalictrum thalictroides]|uniref:Uncharacterized protein n=1 Tax=Thalictrum thalictroides TaxID=46969 RepID=A0A7J6X003_THATH|nr:hypothetical protein FRX31_008354 [Thalictrum thalictroides]
MKAEDIAKAAVFLGSDASSYISGINLAIDVGYSITTPSISSIATVDSQSYPPSTLVQMRTSSSSQLNLSRKSLFHEQ